MLSGQLKVTPTSSQAQPCFFFLENVVMKYVQKDSTTKNPLGSTAFI
jgi:hypothetical protein